MAAIGGGDTPRSPFVGGTVKPTFVNVSSRVPDTTVRSAPTGSSTPSPAPSPSSSGPVSSGAQAALDALNGMASSGSGSAASGSNPLLFWGQKDDMSGQRAARLAAGKPDKQSDRYVTLSDAQAEFYRWSNADRKAWGQYLVGLGLLSEDEAADYGTLQKQWQASLDEAVNFNSVGRQVNPWQAAAMMAGVDNPGSAGKPKPKGFTGTRTSRDTRVDLTDPATAKALVNDVLAKQLGRSATDEEVRSFTSVLHTAEQNNPVVSNTTANYVDGQNTSSSTTNSGGLDSAGRAQLLSDNAMQKPEYGAYQAAATYFPLLAQAIASPV